MTRWRTLTVGNKVAFTCAILVALTLSVALVAAVGVTNTVTDIRSTSRTIPGLERLASLQALGLEYRGTSLLLGTPGLEGEYRKKQIAHLQELRTQMLDVLKEQEKQISGEERPLLASTKVQTDRFLTACEHFRELALSGQLQEAGAFWSAQGGARSKAFRKAIQDQVDLNRSSVNNLAASALSAASFSRTTCLVLSGLSMAVGLVLAWFLITDINQSLGHTAGEIRTVAERVLEAACHVAESSQQLAEAAGEQAASLEETSASGYQISAMTNRNAESSSSAAALMQNVDEQILEANGKLDELIKSMSRITDSGKRIARVTSVIEAIAFQTNILALNAAVEAARSGKAGLGFAVVADEVRNLAHRCSEAARETTLLIEDSVLQANTGCSRLDEVAQAVKCITGSAVTVKTLIEEVSLGVAEQSKGIDQISRALVHMEQVTQQTAANAEESAAASEQLREQSNSIQEIVLQLEAMIA